MTEKKFNFKKWMKEMGEENINSIMDYLISTHMHEIIDYNKSSKYNLPDNWKIFYRNLVIH